MQAIAQNGLTYCENPYDIERYEQLRDLAAEIAAATSLETTEVAFFRQDEIPPVEELSNGRTLPSQIERIFAHYHNPDWPTDFD